MASRTCSTDRPAGAPFLTAPAPARPRPRDPDGRRGPRPLRPRRHRGAFSIAEALTASVVLAIAVVGIAGPLTAASEQAQIAREMSTAVVLAKELMEEIASKPLLDGGGTTCHLGPETASGETSRESYDSADDYHGYADSSATLKNLSKAAVGVQAGYARSVTVEYRTAPAGPAAASGDYGLVTVTVTTPHKQTVKVARLLTKLRVTSTS